MSNLDSFDRQFRRTARDMRRRPAARQWDRIEQRLNHRSAGNHFLLGGIRPWMVAAVLLLAAGFAAVVHLSVPATATVLAQRPESVEELPATTAPLQRIPEYSPLGEGRLDGEVVSRSEPRGRLTAAPKYRF